MRTALVVDSGLHLIWAAFYRFVQRLTSPRWLTLCFLFCAIPTGLGCALLTPIGMFPDEAAHAARADGLRYGELSGFRPSPPIPGAVVNAGVMINLSMGTIFNAPESFAAYPDKPVPAAARQAAEAVRWQNTRVYAATQMVEYVPIFYIPAALGLAAGEVFGLSPLHIFFLGRLAMLSAYLALGALALSLARFGGVLLFTVLTLPTALNLGASYSQDGLLIACCVLAAALLTRAGPGTGRAWFAGLAALLCVTCAKLPYAPLLLLGLAPLCAAGVWRRCAFMLLGCVVPGLWLWHIAGGGFIDYLFPIAYQPGPLWPGPRDIWLHDTVPAHNVKVLLAHPAEMLLLPLRSLIWRWHATWTLALGMFSRDVMEISAWEYPWLAAAVIGSAIASLCGGGRAWRGVDAALAACAVFAAFCTMELSLYLTSTPAGFTFILGVWGRYLLPLLPFFIFILPGLGALLGRLPGAARLPRVSAGWFGLPAVALALVNIYALPALIHATFRAPWP